MKKRTITLTALTLTGLLLAGCTASSTQVSRIDLETAKAAAIEAAGLTTEDVSFLSAELDKRNGIEYYDIDFRADGKEYDYDIDALTGMVIGSETPEAAKKTASEIPVEELTMKLETAAATAETADNKVPAPNNNTEKVSSKEITEAEAKKIALAQVPGAKESDIRGFEIDYDDGRLEYEGSIYYNEMEYEFEIDGYSGAIRSWEVESIYD